MTHKVIPIKDGGGGDGGKGGVVHKVAKMTRAHTVLKGEGTFCGNHGVCTSSGERMAFSQWGCGTLDGIKTHITSLFVASPVGLLNEAQALRYLCGIHNPFDLLTIDEDALCATSYHGIASRLKELALGNNPRGTIGTGSGDAYRSRQRYPELALYACDLSRPDLRERIAAVRAQVARDLASIISGEFLPKDREAAQVEIDRLNDDGFLDYVVERFQEVSRLAHIVDHDYLGRVILPQEGVAVVETSHGILTDHYYGFDPHTSAIRTMPRFTHQMLREAGYQGEIVDLVVHRAYEIRHGAGPMPTHDPTMSEYLLPGSHKEENRYQGKVRVGPLDLVQFRYAIEAAGGPKEFKGAAITWFDQNKVNGKWEVCHRYNGADDPEFFTPAGRIKVRHGEDEAQLAHQRALGQRLLRCTPEITTYDIPKDATPDQLYDLCAGVLNEALGVQVKMLSLGPTEKDKLCR
ncbi:MAG: adenylosuccinate synthetase [Patescibacteria group bacterium]